MSQTKSVSIDDVTAGQAADRLLLDVLPPEHHAARRIPGAVNACIYEVNFLDQVARLTMSKKDTPIIVYGAGEGSLDAVVAADKLSRAGYTHIAVFHGGLEAWKSAGKSFAGTQPDQEDPPHPILVLHESVYTALPEESNIFWTGRNDNSRHIGILALHSGELLHHQGTLRGSFTLDMKSITNIDLAGDEMQPVLEAHLKSDDFFFVSRFPTSTFSINSMRPVHDATATLPNFRVQGTLSLRGISHELEFDANLRSLPENKIALVANFDLDRTRWGNIYGSAGFFKYLSYHIVYDLVSIDLRVVLV